MTVWMCGIVYAVIDRTYRGFLFHGYISFRRGAQALGLCSFALDAAVYGGGDGVTEKELARLQALLAADKGDLFYHWAAWERLRDEVLRLDHYECQLCKARGRYAKAVVVHHVAHVKDRPDLALSLYGDDGGRQLISVCKRCHEELHHEAFRQYGGGEKEEPLTEERWD